MLTLKGMGKGSYLSDRRRHCHSSDGLKLLAAYGPTVSPDSKSFAVLLEGLPEFLVCDDLAGRKRGIRTQHPLAVEVGIGLDFSRVEPDDSLLVKAGQGSRVCSQAFFEGVDDALAGCGVLSLLPGVAADDLSPACHPDLLDLEGRRILGPASLGSNFSVPASSRKDLRAHLLDPAHPGPEDVGDATVRVLKGPDCGITDHAPVGHDTELPDVEPSLDPVDHGQDASHVRGVSRPHLGADRPAVVAEDRPYHHLFPLRPVVLPVAEPAETLSSLAFEVDGGGTKEDKLDPGEEIPIGREQAFFDKVLYASGREGGGAALVLQGLAKEGHGPVHLVERPRLGLPDGTITPPALTGAVRAGFEEPVEYGHKDSPFHIELELASPQEPTENLPDAELLPEPLEDQIRPNSDSAGIHITLARKDKESLLGESRQGPDQVFDPALGFELVKTGGGSDDPLDDLAADLPVFHDLKVLVPAGFFDSREHGAPSTQPPDSTVILARPVLGVRGCTEARHIAVQNS